MSSNFDPSAFLDATISEPTTKRNPIPAGLDVTAIIGEPKARSWVGKADPTKSGIVIDVPLEIDLTAYPGLEEQVGSKKVTLTDGIMLDTTAAGGIDNSPGKNGKLRRYREALGMNEAGQPFSMRAMQGRLIKVKISHRTYEGEIFDQVEAVAKA
jgi:hypothetical protein